MSMQPTIFVGHGGGPLPLLGKDPDLMKTWAPGSRAHDILHDVSVKAIVVISAHHESEGGEVLVMEDSQPALLFDYGGFPPETYKYSISNPGNPELSVRIEQLLSEARIPCRLEKGRGHDHGVFVPLLGMGVPQARPSLPIVSVSLRGPADFRINSGKALTHAHWEMGRALNPLRREGVVLLGSGNSIHGRTDDASGWDGFLQDLALGKLTTKTGAKADLRSWESHAQARKCHARPEHLLPLLVVAGAAEPDEDKTEAISHICLGKPGSHFIFSHIDASQDC